MSTKPVKVIHYLMLDIHTVTRETEQVTGKCYSDYNLQTRSILHLEQIYRHTLDPEDGM